MKPRNLSNKPKNLSIYRSIFRFLGYFSHFLGFRGILIIFQVSNVFQSFFRFRRYFDNFQVSGVFQSFSMFGGINLENNKKDLNQAKDTAQERAYIKIFFFNLEKMMPQMMLTSYLLQKRKLISKLIYYFIDIIPIT